MTGPAPIHPIVVEAMSDFMHPSPSELKQTLSDAQNLELGSSKQLQLLERLRASCPAFIPGLLISSRAMLWGKEDAQDSAAFFDEVEQILRNALDASGRQTGPLLGIGEKGRRRRHRGNGQQGISSV